MTEVVVYQKIKVRLASGRFGINRDTVLTVTITNPNLIMVVDIRANFSFVYSTFQDVISHLFSTLRLTTSLAGRVMLRHPFSCAFLPGLKLAALTSRKLP